MPEREFWPDLFPLPLSGEMPPSQSEQGEDRTPAPEPDQTEFETAGSREIEEPTEAAEFDSAGRQTEPEAEPPLVPETRGADDSSALNERAEEARQAELDRLEARAADLHEQGRTAQAEAVESNIDQRFPGADGDGGASGDDGGEQVSGETVQELLTDIRNMMAEVAETLRQATE